MERRLCSEETLSLPLAEGFEEEDGGGDGDV